MNSAAERAIERLRSSKAEFMDDAKERGRGVGAAWATDTAEYEELKRLADARIEGLETNNRMGPGFIVAAIDPDRCTSRSDVVAFWESLGFDRRDPDLDWAEFWEGFAEGAVEVFEPVEASITRPR